MKLVVQCQKCNQKNATPHFHTDRIDYAKKYGDNFNLVCSNCNEENTFHVDDIVALQNDISDIIKKQMILFIVSMVIIFITSLFFASIINSILIASLAEVIIATLFYKMDEGSTTNFNKYKLKGRVSGVNFVDKWENKPQTRSRLKR